VPWSAPFELPNGRDIVTLEDAGNYIAKLPKAELDAPEWQAAMKALILIAERGALTTRADRRHARLEPARRAVV
jgi:hypothetical protein